MRFCNRKIRVDALYSNRHVNFKAVARYVSEGTKSSGTGAKPANHINRISEVILERDAIFKKIIEREGCAAIEFDHGSDKNVTYSTFMHAQSHLNL